MICKKYIGVLLGVLVLFSGCGQKGYEYFAALRCQSDGNAEEARRLFLRAVNTGSPYISRLASEELINLGNVRERIEACDRLISKFPDEKSKLLAAGQYFSASEYSRLIQCTNDIDYAECSNKLAYLRLEAMRKKGDSRFFKEFYTWFTVRKISDLHYQLYCDVSKADSLPNIPEFQPVTDFRADVFKRNYAGAFETFSSSKDMLPLLPQIVSDMGKVCLYGSDSYYKNALSFDAFAKKLSGRDSEFYAQFYAARLYEKAGEYYSYAANRYQAAMKCAKTDSQYDNALWYLMNLELKRSTARGIQCVRKYCSTWHDPDYFEDFFDTLTPLMLSEGRWNDFYALYKDLDGYATDEVVAKFAYIYGRLLQEKLAVPVLSDTHGSDSSAAFTRALLSGSEAYYKVMAISRLGLGGEHAEEILCTARSETVQVVDPEAEEILAGYAAFGLPEKIYPMYRRLHEEKREISFDTGLRLAQFLNECGHNKNEFYPQSLRLMASILSLYPYKLNREALKILYPRNYSETVTEFCTKYSIPKPVMYALIRSESYFDSGAKSSAGAVGLCQLMESTAADIAHRLKYGSYNLTAPKDNIEFGCWYVANLFGRLENHWLNTFFSYNSGINVVRRWRKSAIIEFDNMKFMPDDLFLETIPYSETRQYGRKLIGAAALYSWLYYDKELCESINVLVK